MSAATTKQNEISAAPAASPTTRFGKFINAAAFTFAYLTGITMMTDTIYTIGAEKSMSGATAFSMGCLRSDPSTPTVLRPVAGFVGASAQMGAGFTDALLGPSATVRSQTCKPYTW